MEQNKSVTNLQEEISIKLLKDEQKQEFIHYLQTIPFYFNEDVLLDEADLKNFEFNDLNEYIIATVRKEIIGHIAIQYQEYKYGYHQEHCIEVHINIAKEYQNKGIGKTLLEYMLKHIQTKTKISKIKTKMLENNQAAIQLFESFGFVKEAVLEKEWKVIIKDKEEYINGIYMKRILRK
ncbi:GNAT family N-acetyltransferase [Candidatus Woesearchaeota archaeon]|nr:GNAT family N-acetyltransferase [Candidatus Woesearchaeota archaeon]